MAGDILLVEDDVPKGREGLPKEVKLVGSTIIYI